MFYTKQDHKQAISKKNSGRTPELFFKMAESVFWRARKLCSNERGLSSYEKAQHPEWLVLIFHKKTTRKKRRWRTQGMAKRYAFHAIEAKIKTKKIIKTLVEIFKIWLGIIQSGISQVGIFRGEFTRGILIG